MYKVIFNLGLLLAIGIKSSIKFKKEIVKEKKEEEVIKYLNKILRGLLFLSKSS
jgi:hypothetical protein